MKKLIFILLFMQTLYTFCIATEKKYTIDTLSDDSVDLINLEHDDLQEQIDKLSGKTEDIENKAKQKPTNIYASDILSIRRNNLNWENVQDNLYELENEYLTRLGSNRLATRTLEDGNWFFQNSNVLFSTSNTMTPSYTIDLNTGSFRAMSDSSSYILYNNGYFYITGAGGQIINYPGANPPYIILNSNTPGTYEPYISLDGAYWQGKYGTAYTMTTNADIASITDYTRNIGAFLRYTGRDIALNDGTLWWNGTSSATSTSIYGSNNWLSLYGSNNALANGYMVLGVSSATMGNAWGNIQFSTNDCHITSDKVVVNSSLTVTDETYLSSSTNSGYSTVGTTFTIGTGYTTQFKTGNQTYDITYTLPYGATDTDKGRYLQIDENLNMSWQDLPIVGEQQYFFSIDNSDIAGYYNMYSTYPYVTYQSYAFTQDNSDVCLGTWTTLSGYPSNTIIPAGIWNIHFHADQTNTTGGKDLQVYGKFFRRGLDGTEVFISSSEISSVFTGNIEEYEIHFTTGTLLLNTSDRILASAWTYVTGSGLAPSATFYFGGNYFSYMQLPAPAVSIANFPPYNGATQDMNIGENSLISASSITANSLYSNDLTLSDSIAFSSNPYMNEGDPVFQSSGAVIFPVLDGLIISTGEILVELRSSTGTGSITETDPVFISSESLILWKNQQASDSDLLDGFHYNEISSGTLNLTSILWGDGSIQVSSPSEGGGSVDDAVYMQNPSTAILNMAGYDIADIMVSSASEVCVATASIFNKCLISTMTDANFDAYPFVVHKDVNGFMGNAFVNNNNGMTGRYLTLSFCTRADGASAGLYKFGSGYPTSNQYEASSLLFENYADMNFAVGNAKNMSFWENSAEKMRINTSVRTLVGLDVQAGISNSVGTAVDFGSENITTTGLVDNVDVSELAISTGVLASNVSVDTNTLQGLIDAVYTSSQPFVKIYRSAAVVIPINEQFVPFDTAAHDDWNMFDYATWGSSIIIPSAGLWEIIAHVGFDDFIGGTNYVTYLRINNGYNCTQAIYTNPGGNTYTPDLIYQGVLSAGTQIVVKSNHNDGTNPVLSAGTGGSFMTVRKIQ